MRDMDSRVKDIIAKAILRQKSVGDGKSDIHKGTVGLNRHNFYLHKKVLTDDTELGHLKNDIALNNSFSDINQAIVFVDKEPHLNWAHECEYHMYNGDTGEHIQTIPARMPPVSFILSSEQYEAVGDLVQRPDMPYGNIKLKPIDGLDGVLSKKTGERYAILFSGLTYYRHLNDLEYLYRTLIHVYQFNPENITVLSCLGTLDYFVDPNDPVYPKGIWPGDNTPYQLVVNGKGSKPALAAALKGYSTKLSGDDLLLIHTNGHGDGPKVEGEAGLSSLMCMFDSPPPQNGSQPDIPEFDCAEYADILKTFPEFDTMVVMMEQCHSGGFSEPTMTGSKARSTVFSAACLPWKESAGAQKFDPYAFCWISKVSQSDAVDVNSAYDYARENTVPSDTPNDANKPENCGDGISLR
ncbi:hypothetical protein DFR58_12319 [Anaerobacterium chartisolvens]|uniref:Caspase domain-containing protein n=1 Tax=Anaerobacterium chartisolvens TaxID=1297424 RepID=A0A369AS82_9FIRM|nr:hypothetical protein [Anaerobacterium chartisolvens]RCX12209.1 hypothetical protein DFR58_12319 [Anaerobacterium chartisolvens]